MPENNVINFGVRRYFKMREEFYAKGGTKEDLQRALDRLEMTRVVSITITIDK